jgi:hypothetical protein
MTRSPAFRDGLSSTDIEGLLPWLTAALNIVFSHVADPTNFADKRGTHDPGAQMAWLLTFERMLADGILLMAGVNEPALTRVQVAFDLLDKAAALAGCGKREDKAFKALLRQSAMVPRLQQVWEGLPTTMRAKFRTHTATVYASLYEGVRDGALQHRLTRKGIKIAKDDPRLLTSISMDDYVPDLIREVRNSQHGFSRLLTDERRLLVATHDGRLPPPLAHAAALVMLGLLADAKALVAGTWLN